MGKQRADRKILPATLKPNPTLQQYVKCQLLLKRRYQQYETQQMRQIKLKCWQYAKECVEKYKTGRNCSHSLQCAVNTFLSKRKTMLYVRPAHI